MQSKTCVKSALLTAAVAGLAGVAGAGGPFGTQPIGPDITLCQLYGFSTPSTQRSGTFPTGISGGSVATTSWNIGTVNAQWQQAPDPDHPKIAMNLYRKRTFTMSGVQIDRFQQIGQSWCKHGFFALSDEQCGPHPFAGQNGVPPWTGACASTNGTALGVGCTDTYSAGLNATQSRLGPRFEINPWTADWASAGSFLTAGPSNTPIRRRLQFLDQDCIAPAGETYAMYIEAQYVSWDDVDFMTSVGHKPVSSYSWSGTAWNFVTSGSTTDEVMGFAYDQWTGARQTMIAQSFPIVEKWTADADGPGGAIESPDGRAMILSKVFNLGNGTWQYEYAVYNLDMDRQIGSFFIPIPAGVTITGIGSSAVFSHDEPTNKTAVNGGKPIDNDPWPGLQGGSGVQWATDPYIPTGTASNPLRWGTMYNFWFTADTAPVDGMSTVGLFTAGPVTSLDGVTNVPSAPPPPPHCLGDADGDMDRDFADVSMILARFGEVSAPGSASPGDSNNDGVVDFGDVTTTLSLFGQPC
jgi:hypothetical protein